MYFLVDDVNKPHRHVISKDAAALQEHCVLAMQWYPHISVINVLFISITSECRKYV